MHTRLLPTLLCLLVTSSFSAASEHETARPDSGGGARSRAPIVVKQDTSVFTGTGLNTRLVPIDRPVPGGVMRKDPGSRTWSFIRGLSEAELRAEHERYLQELLRIHGHEPRDIVIEVKDTVDVAKLRRLLITVPEAPPCTVAVRVFYRDLPKLKEARLLYWSKGQARALKRLKPAYLVPKRSSELAPSDTPPPSSPPKTSSGRVSTESVDVFTEGFESNTVPGSVWAATDENSFSGLDYWGDLRCDPPPGQCFAYVHTGNWSAHCAGHSDVASFSYDNDENAYMRNPPSTTRDMSPYGSYQVQFFAWYSTETNRDFLRFRYYTDASGWVTFQSYSGSSGGWVQIYGPVILNDGHAADHFQMEFRFESDFSIVSTGAYIDDIVLLGIPAQPNLKAYDNPPPPGWSYAIVPSSVTGTTTVGTLYAGQPTYIDWAIQNNSSANASSTFYIDYYLDGALIGGDTVFGLNGGTGYFRTDWSYPSYQTITLGPHTLKMVIDPTGAIAESDEGDNVYQQTFTWVQPDLIVQSMTFTPSNPPVGQQIDVAVTIKNQGTGAANRSFYTDLYQNPGHPPSQGELYDQTHLSTSLAAGATETFHFFASSQTATPWTMYCYVDGTNSLPESNESNNRSLGVPVSWTAGSVSISGRFAWDDSLLGPNQPMRCMHIVVYQSRGGVNGDSLKMANTDNTGNWGPITLTNQDTGGDQGHLDLFVRAYFATDATCLGSNAVAVQDYYGQRYAFDTPTVTNIADGSYSYGTVKPTDYGRKTVSHLYETILRGFDYIRSFGNSVPFVYVRWTAGDGFETGYVSATPAVFVVGKYSYYAKRFWPDEWDDGIVLHEYGHHVARSFNFVNIPAGPQTHSPDTLSQSNGVPSKEVAWNEGWAWYFSGQVRGSRYTTNYGDSLGLKTRDTLDVERGTYWDSITNRTVNINDRGTTWEGPNAGILWDIADAVNDNPNGDVYSDHLSGIAANVWDALRNPGTVAIANVDSFYRVYQPRYANRSTQPTLLEALNQVYCEHGDCAPPLVAVDLDGPAARFWSALLSRPNPFRSATTLVLDVPSSGEGHVTLRVFDVAGHLVRTLVDGGLTRGRYAFAWDGRASNGDEVAPGVYFAHLVGFGTRQSLKLLVLK